MNKLSLVAAWAVGGLLACATITTAQDAPKKKGPTVEQRVARGRAARAQVPRSAHAEWKFTQRTQSPLDLLEEQADPCTGTGPDSLRPDGRLAVRLLPRRGVAHGG